MSQEAREPNNDAAFLSGVNPKTDNVERKAFTNRIEETLTQNRSVIGKNIRFRGELIGEEDLHIEGTVEGTVIMQGQDLSIGKEGEINANVHANNITVHGKLTGDVLANELIEIKNTAIVKGNLIAPRIQLDDGGKFRGSMDMTDNEQDIKQRYEEFKAKLVHPDLPGSKDVIAAKTMETGNKPEASSKPESNTKPDTQATKQAVSAEKQDKPDNLPNLPNNKPNV